MSNWLIPLSRNDRPTRGRVVALPHAGGWPSAFAPWRPLLPDDVDLLVAQLPGHGARLSEEPLRRVEPMVAGLVEELAEHGDLPTVVVGHSSGSVLGYALSRALEASGRPPRLLVVSARQPPCFPDTPPFAHRRPDAELLEHLVMIGGVSTRLAERREMIGPILAAVRADLEAMETYGRPATETAVPVLAVGAADDPVVVTRRMPLWSLETTGGFRWELFEGDHFSFYGPETTARVLDRVLEALRLPVGPVPSAVGSEGPPAGSPRVTVP
ncbi:thioesterase II family protein [Nocardiopsis halotolerans]|uniref:thioesterase II family protein n=1 Tax=Nocardiopsis halotolerans TaxID=124252 RepID=UPI00036693D6|nr:alpha/beta fold hydrolase [Nocardiopsis halotolerans]